MAEPRPAAKAEAFGAGHRTQPKPPRRQSPSGSARRDLRLHAPPDRRIATRSLDLFHPLLFSFPCRLPVTGDGEISGLALGGGVAAERTLSGIGVAPIGLGSGDDIRGIGEGGVGVGAGGTIRGIARNRQSFLVLPVLNDSR